MKKNFIQVVLLSAALFLTACAAASAPEAAQQAANSEEAGHGAGLSTVVLYSNALSDGRGEWIQEQAALIGLDVQLVDGGGVAIANRLIAERYNPLADVVFGLNQMLWIALEENNVLAPYSPEWALEVPAHLNHDAGLYHAVILVGNLLTYDMGQISPEYAPEDWLDLWQNEAFHGRYAIPNALTGSTVQMILSGIFNRFLDPGGHLGISDDGWENIAAKFRYGVVTDLDMFAEIVNPSSDAAMSQMWSHGVPVREEQFGIQAGIVVPEVGVPFSIEGVALINGANNPEAAIRFIDWFGTSEVMHAFSYEFGFLPAHPDALEGLGGMTLTVADIPHQEINWPVVAAGIGEWLEHIYLEYMQ